MVRMVSPGGSRWSSGTPTSMTKHPPGSRWAAALRKHPTCASCVVRFMVVLKDQVREAKRAVDGRSREVAERNADVFGPRLRTQPGDHRFRQLDSVHRHAIAARAVTRS